MQFHQVVKEEFISEGSTHRQTILYTPLLDSRGIKICAVSNFINTGGGVIWVFFI